MCPGCGHPTMTKHTIRIGSLVPPSVYYRCNRCGDRYTQEEYDNAKALRNAEEKTTVIIPEEGKGEGVDVVDGK